MSQGEREVHKVKKDKRKPTAPKKGKIIPEPEDAEPNEEGQSEEHHSIRADDEDDKPERMKITPEVSRKGPEPPKPNLASKSVDGLARADNKRKTQNKAKDLAAENKNLKKPVAQGATSSKKPIPHQGVSNNPQENEMVDSSNKNEQKSNNSRNSSNKSIQYEEDSDNEEEMKKRTSNPIQAHKERIENDHLIVCNVTEKSLEIKHSADSSKFLTNKAKKKLETYQRSLESRETLITNLIAQLELAENRDPQKEAEAKKELENLKVIMDEFSLLKKGVDQDLDGVMNRAGFIMKKSDEIMKELTERMKKRHELMVVFINALKTQAKN